MYNIFADCQLQFSPHVYYTSRGLVTTLCCICWRSCLLLAKDDDYDHTTMDGGSSLARITINNIRYDAHLPSFLGTLVTDTGVKGATCIENSVANLNIAKDISARRYYDATDVCVGCQIAVDEHSDHATAIRRLNQYNIVSILLGRMCS